MRGEVEITNPDLSPKTALIGLPPGTDVSERAEMASSVDSEDISHAETDAPDKADDSQIEDRLLETKDGTNITVVRRTKLRTHMYDKILEYLKNGGSGKSEHGTVKQKTFQSKAKMFVVKLIQNREELVVEVGKRNAQGEWIFEKDLIYIPEDRAVTIVASIIQSYQSHRKTMIGRDKLFKAVRESYLGISKDFCERFLKDQNIEFVKMISLGCGVRNRCGSPQELSTSQHTPAPMKPDEFRRVRQLQPQMCESAIFHLYNVCCEIASQHPENLFRLIDANNVTATALVGAMLQTSSPSLLSSFQSHSGSSDVKFPLSGEHVQSSVMSVDDAQRAAKQRRVGNIHGPLEGSMHSVTEMSAPLPELHVSSAASMDTTMLSVTAPEDVVERTFSTASAGEQKISPMIMAAQPQMDAPATNATTAVHHSLLQVPLGFPSRSSNSGFTSASRSPAEYGAPIPASISPNFTAQARNPYHCEMPGAFFQPSSAGVGPSHPALFHGNPALVGQPFLTTVSQLGSRHPSPPQQEPLPGMASSHQHTLAHAHCQAQPPSLYPYVHGHLQPQHTQQHMQQPLPSHDPRVLLQRQAQQYFPLSGVSNIPAPRVAIGDPDGSDQPNAAGQQ